MKNWRLLILFVCSFGFNNFASGQNISNEGRDFWVVFPTHDPSNSLLANLKIYVTSKEETTVTVSVPGEVPITQTILPNTAVPFSIPRSAVYIDANDAGRVLSSRSIHVTVPVGKPKVAVYAHIFAGFRSAATLILPVEALGQKYFSMNYTQNPNGNSVSKNFIVLAATEDDTHLIIRIANSSETIQVHLLKAGDVFEYLPSGLQDLTGSVVEIDNSFANNCSKRFAVFSGSTSVSIGGTCARSLDPLFQQLYPTTSWGKEYGIVPFINRLYALRIVAEEDNTSVQVDGQQITLRAGEFYSTGFLSKPMFVRANKNVSVAQYALSEGCGNISGIFLGDPDMVILNPVEFNIKSVTMFSSSDQEILEKYINVFIKTSAASSFRIDGRAVGGWQRMPSDPSYSYVQFPVIDNTFRLTANDGFNAIAYGFGATESYAYSAGTNLAANNFLLINNTSTDIDAPNACIGQKSKFKITLDFKAIEINWKLDDQTEVSDTPEPTLIQTSRGTSYVYEYSQQFTFAELTKHRMLVTVQKPDDGRCLSGSVEYEFTFDVYPLPIAKFLVDTDPCPDTDVQFTDDNSNSLIPGMPVNKWFWDFGDGNNSIEQNPVHKYTSSGEFEVKFFAGVDDGCLSEPTIQKVTVKPKITPKIILAQTGCANVELLFSEASTVENNGTISKWEWDLGDGNKSSSQNFSHTYSAAGLYTVKLMVTSNDGCINTQSQTIDIKGSPEPDFVLPDACVTDVAFFENISTDAKGGSGSLKYLWDFGDNTVAAADNTSNSEDGAHRYRTAGDYTVTLTVTNEAGCTFLKKQTVTINGASITPGFEVKGENDLCSNNPIVLVNTSKVNSGRITRIEFYMGATGAPLGTPDIVDTNPLAGKEYSSYKYPAFTSTATQTFTITMIAYSGKQCFESIKQTITVKPSPAVVFYIVPPICLNAGPTKITQAKETLGVPGSYQFSGPGITPDGVFDPIVAGLGTHTITYTFSGQNSCTESLTREIIVFPSPVITLEKEIFVLIGGQRKLTASSTGNGLTYKWSPSTGLDRDDIPNPTVTGDDDRVYTLTITNDQGCSSSQTVKLNILRVVEPFNAFSPNGDNTNDTWGIKYIDSYPDVEVEIFNRFGQRVFYSKGYKVPFNGNFNNEPLPVGVYYYIINPNIGTKKVTGSLTIIR
jgi:gliding motility-associated-like protein